MWRYVAAKVRGGIIDPTLRDSVLPKLKELDTAENRRSFWQHMLDKAPHLSMEVSPSVDAQEPDSPAALGQWIDRIDLDLPQRIARVYGGEPLRDVLRPHADKARELALQIRKSNTDLPALPVATGISRADLEAIQDWCITAGGGSGAEITGLEGFKQPVRLTDAASIIGKRSDEIGRALRTAVCKYAVVNRRAYGEHEDLCKLFHRYRKHHEKL